MLILRIDSFLLQVSDKCYPNPLSLEIQVMHSWCKVLKSHILQFFALLFVEISSLSEFHFEFYHSIIISVNTHAQYFYYHTILPSFCHIPSSSPTLEKSLSLSQWLIRVAASKSFVYYQLSFSRQWHGVWRSSA